MPEQEMVIKKFLNYYEVLMLEQEMVIKKFLNYYEE